MTEESFPRARRVQLGYSRVEDRVLLRLYWVSGDGAAACWLPRRILVSLSNRLNEALRRSHPATDGEPAHDAVLALEHEAARAEVAGQRQAEADGSDAATQEAEPEEAAGSGSGPGSGPGSESEPEAEAPFLVTDARVEARGEQLLLGLLGHRLPAYPGRVPEPEPIAGLALSRSQAHEVLRMLAEQAKQADWGVPRRLSWMAWLRTKSDGG